MTQVEKTLSALMGGRELTAKQISAWYKAKNPYEVVRRIREQGHVVDLSEHYDSKGRRTAKYSLVVPPKKKARR